jgi:hypothetical protein
MQNKYFTKVEHANNTIEHRTVLGKTYDEIISKIYSDPKVIALTIVGIELPNGSWVPGHKRTWTPGTYDIKE